MATINKRNGKYCVIYYYVDAKGKKRQKWETFDSKKQYDNLEMT